HAYAGAVFVGSEYDVFKFGYRGQLAIDHDRGRNSLAVRVGRRPHDACGNQLGLGCYRRIDFGHADVEAGKLVGVDPDARRTRRGKKLKITHARNTGYAVLDV